MTTAEPVLEAFRRALRQWPAAGRCHLAFSGGLDSTVLVDLALRCRQELPPLHALYVDHGLQPDSGHWAAHCATWCAARGLDFTALALDGKPPAGESLEAWARRARYAALATCLAPGDLLLTAHHADDQLETFLLQALRGAGPAGLAAMAPLRRLEPGWLARPLLELTREQLRDYAEARKLAWIDDPSNADPALDRNYLRSAVLPALRARWPQAARTLSRSAHQCAQASEQLTAWGEAQLAAGMVADGALVLTRWSERPERERRLLLRHWLAEAGLPLPSTRMLAAIADQLARADADRQILLGYPGVEIRRHQGRAYAGPPLAPVPDVKLPWLTPSQPLALPGDLGRLVLDAGPGGLDPQALAGRRLEVGFRRGGERIRLPAHAHHQMLTELCRRARLAPWVRDRLPLLWVDGALAAVANQWVAAPFAAPPAAPGLRLRWAMPATLHPGLFDGAH
ncbi:tRNA lysidine(34) synthetase TilS [Pseudoxanthomonas sp.]|uniref:tRNA lysidine(34) synthetase TilS n=1 Tax=Pseudoxanthomonas sp. TaxID=1871049 RepID=UPI0025E5C0D1|nr:tRNA lysidine(34) synthetase TilS [Pseudoxanthomonas sp.]